MPNETKAEEIVWEHFRKFGSAISLERKGTNTPRVKKLLRSASKQGSGKTGFPDFIVMPKEHPDFLIVAECKADTAKHESKNQDKWAEYAVDGALFYADHLAREFDVLAIAFSGTSKSLSKVSHFLQLKQGSPQPIFQNRLLSMDDYIRGYYDEPSKVSQDYESLRQFIKDMNTRLHVNKVHSKNRALLIASILIALERKSFRESYVHENDSQALAKSITANVSNELSASRIASDRAKKLAEQFGVAETESALLSGHQELRNIVTEVDQKINSFRKNHQFVDVLGEMYVEFLRYANSEKGLGIVLTPRHVTEFFSEIAKVSKNSIVYDNCAGTGGFLIAAMNRMIADAGGDTKKEDVIKRKQLFGVELQSDIFPLLLANMYVHQDGKANMIHGDCFDTKVIKQIKNKKPTVGLLNPPYRSDKKKDRNELEFVIKNLDCLQENSVCVALLPMSCAIATSGKAKELKRDLMKNHTLEAVLSLPDELFFNSKVGVVTCAMIFKANQEHVERQEVFLGYYKDDGFVKSKTTGRSDLNNQWENKMQKWIETYRNKKEIPGFSTKIELTPEMDWSAEAYMETDYAPIDDSRVASDLFTTTLLEYSSYLFSYKIISSASSLSQNKKKTKLPPTKDWGKYRLKDYFKIKGTKTTPLTELGDRAEPVDGYPYVTTRASNNGVESFYSGTPTETGGVLTVDSAVQGFCSYQSQAFFASDHVEKLVPDFEGWDEYIAMFVATIINMEQYRYNYGRKCSQTNLRKTEIKLPSSEQGTPDWNLIRRYIKSLPYSSNLKKN